MNIRTLLPTMALALGLGAPALAGPPVLTVYTYDSFASEWGPGPVIEKGFEEICGCDLQFVGLDSSIGAFNRLRLEGASSKADILLGLDVNLAGAARASGPGGGPGPGAGRRLPERPGRARPGRSCGGRPSLSPPARAG